MNISGIRPSEGFYSYNEIKINELRNQQISAAQKAHSVEEKQDIEEAVAEAMSHQTFTSYDYAQTYNPNDTFDRRGVVNDISELDVERAISDLERDQVLEQYRYFVGSQLSNTVKEIPAEVQSDMTLRSGENFIL
ncbi:MAG: hypothetical protein U0K68_11240 [Agathobacter sp.]|nr:hypothetical protein [Agathobacter sp.]